MKIKKTKISLNRMKLKKGMVQEQRLQLKMKILLGYKIKIVVLWKGGGRVMGKFGGGLFLWWGKFI